METDSKDLYVSFSQFRKFLGNPVLIPLRGHTKLTTLRFLGAS